MAEPCNRVAAPSRVRRSVADFSCSGLRERGCPLADCGGPTPADPLMSRLVRGDDDL